MRKIAFYINKLFDGGAERVISILANQMSDMGYDVFMITTWRYEEDFSLRSNIHRVVLRELDSRCQSSNKVIRNVFLIKNLRRTIQTNRIDVLVSFMGEPNFRNVLATRNTLTKSVVSVRTDPNREYGGRVGRFIGERILPLADGAVFQTNQAIVWFPEKLQKKSCVIPNPIDDTFFVTKRKSVRHRIVTCGRLTEVKNHIMQLEAVEILSKIYPDIELLIYGIGESQEQIEKTIENKGLSSSVRLMGQTSDVADALSTAEIFVLSSNFEGMPNALMEAMAAGIPCISTDCPCGGPRELIEDGVNGWLVPVGDSKALAEKISYVFDYPGEAEIVGKHAAEKMRDYTAEKIAERWRIFLLPVCQNK